MKCKSCNETIEPRMRKALTANECPYCGGSILDKESMQQFLDLHSVLDSQRFTDSQEHDKKIKEKVVRILMEYMKCVKVKDVKQDDDIVKLNEKTTRSISAAQATQPKDPLVTEQKKMRKDMYVEAYKEQYGAEPQETNIEEEEVLPEDVEAAKGVVFSNTDDPEMADKVERLRASAASKPRGVNKPITRVQ